MKWNWKLFTRTWIGVHFCPPSPEKKLKLALRQKYRTNLYRSAVQVCLFGDNRAADYHRFAMIFSRFEILKTKHVRSLKYSQQFRTHLVFFCFSFHLWGTLEKDRYDGFLPRCMECRRGLAMRILSVRLSVRLSVTRVHCDKTVERSVQIYIPYERTFILVFWEEEWLVGGEPL